MSKIAYSRNELVELFAQHDTIAKIKTLAEELRALDPGVVIVEHPYLTYLDAREMPKLGRANVGTMMLDSRTVEITVIRPTSGINELDRWVDTDHSLGTTLQPAVLIDRLMSCYGKVMADWRGWIEPGWPMIKLFHVYEQQPRLAASFEGVYGANAFKAAAYDLYIDYFKKVVDLFESAAGPAEDYILMMPPETMVDLVNNLSPMIKMVADHTAIWRKELGALLDDCLGVRPLRRYATSYSNLLHN